MKTTWQLIRQELHLLQRERLAPWAIAILVLLLLAAAINGRLLLAAQLQTAASLERDAATLVSALADQAARGVDTATQPGPVGFSVLAAPAVLPPASLAAFAIGQSDLLPSQYQVTARGAHTFLASQELDNPLRLALGNFDVAFVIVWLLPLVVIALSFNLVSGERERGVLAMSVAAGASPSGLIFVKLVARVGSLLVALAVALIGTAVLADATMLTGRGVATGLAWLLGAVLYALVWFALALWVNARARSSDQNATFLAGAWLLFVIVAPALTNLAAVTAFAPPSRVALTTELREATEQADRESAADRDRYFFDHPEMQGGDMDTTAYYQSVARTEASVEQAMAPLLAQFDTQAARQQRVVGALQYLSPGTLTYQLLTALAGTDGSRHREFRAQTAAFHRDWVGFFTSRLNNGERLTAADYAALPGFRFQELPLSSTLVAVATYLAVLAGLTIVLLWRAQRRLRRLLLI